MRSLFREIAMAEKTQSSVSRTELYLLLSSTYLFILLVHLAAGQRAEEKESWLAVINQAFLMVALLAMQLMFLGLALYHSARDRAAKRRREQSGQESS
jgi:hypothetical protein